MQIINIFTECLQPGAAQWEGGCGSRPPPWIILGGDIASLRVPPQIPGAGVLRFFHRKWFLDPPGASPPRRKIFPPFLCKFNISRTVQRRKACCMSLERSLSQLQHTESPIGWLQRSGGGFFTGLFWKVVHLLTSRLYELFSQTAYKNMSYTIGKLLLPTTTY